MNEALTFTTDTVGAARATLRHHLGNSAEGDQLLCHTLNCERAHLYAHPEATLAPAYKRQLTTLLQRRLAGVPLAHLTGTCEFFSLEFEITPDVLIPRPETEALVETTLTQIAKDAHAGAQILDLGTGCGAIAIAIAVAHPDATIIACDNSRAALTLAKRNAKRHGVCNVCFVKSDWYEQLPDARFHTIVANPPYVSAGDSALDPNVAAYEPDAALFAENNGLACLQTIITRATSRLHDHGTLLLEHGHTQATSVARMMTQVGFEKVYCHTDLSGHPRMTVGFKPSI